MENLVPVVVKNEDGSCVVAFPDGVQLVTANLDGAAQVVDYYLRAEERESRNQIGFIPAMERTRNENR